MEVAFTGRKKTCCHEKSKLKTLTRCERCPWA